MRVVSLNCSNTEIVAALGAGGELVGVDDDSDHPVELVRGLPRVGRDLDVDVARVAALAPDLVLASNTVPGHEKVIERLTAARLPYFAPETTSWAGVLDDVREIGRRLGRAERAAALAAEMDARTAPDTNRGAASPAAPSDPATLPPPRTKILVEWWPRPVIVPGRRSWVTDLIERAGGVNPFGDEPVKSRPVSDGEVVARDPDAVVLSWCGVKPDKVRPDVVHARIPWRATRALATGNVHCIPEALLGRPGPRLVEGFLALSAIVQRAARRRD
jgi:iron complex transport system substrate-binding protein